MAVIRQLSSAEAVTLLVPSKFVLLTSLRGKGEEEMRHAIAWGAVFAAGVLAGALSGEVVNAQVSPYQTRQVARSSLNNLPGQELLVFESTWQPGFRLPLSGVAILPSRLETVVLNDRTAASDPKLPLANVRLRASKFLYGANVYGVGRPSKLSAKMRWNTTSSAPTSQFGPCGRGTPR